MLVSDIMDPGTECTEDTPIEKVYEMIQRSGEGFVVVIDSENHRVPLGVVNEHSICEQIIAKGRKLRGLTAGNVLDSRFRKFKGSAPVENLKEFNPGSAIVLVVDGKGGYCGLVPRDVLAAVREKLSQGHTADAEQQPRPAKAAPSAIEIPAFGLVH